MRGSIGEIVVYPLKAAPGMQCLSPRWASVGLAGDRLVDAGRR